MLAIPPACPPFLPPARQVRGVSHEAVQERERPKSMLAAKSFNPTYDLEAIRKWCGILAQASQQGGCGRWAKLSACQRGSCACVPAAHPTLLRLLAAGWC